MNESLSIDEIIKQAEEIRNKTLKQAQSALKDAENSGREITQREIKVPKPDVNSVKVQKSAESKKSTESVDAQKTQEIKKPVKSAEKDADKIDKTKKIELNKKSENTDEVKEYHSKRQKSFFTSSNSGEPLYSKKPPEIVERPATIKSKSKFSKTADLQEIPTIVAVEELEKTKISLTREELKEKEVREKELKQQEEAVQIVLEGFDDETVEIDKIDEDLAEQQLKERRKDKVNKFRLFSPEDIEESTDRDTVVKKEYFGSKEQEVFSKRIAQAKSSSSLMIKITAVLTLILGLLTGFKDSSYLPSILLDNVPYIITMLVIFIITLAVNFKTLIHGFNFKGGINSDFPVSLMQITVLVHTSLMLVDTNILLDDGALYPFATAFALLMSNMGKYVFITRIITDFDFLQVQKEKYTVEPIVNKVDAEIISRGLLTGEDNLKTSIKTDNPTKFFEIGSSDEPADKISKVTALLMLVLSAALFLAVFFINENRNIGFNVFVCAMCISMPCYTLFCSNNALLGISKRLHTNNAMVNGYEGASITNDTNAIVLEAQDLFGPRSCEIHGIKTFNGAKADDVILKTAAVMINTKSPLSYVFDDVIIGKQSILPEVDGLVYEDKMGTSAWIYRKKILVGTRELLIHHGVPVLKEEYEKKYTRKGRKVLYLAVTGKLMAMFVVSYNAETQLKKALKKLEKSGMTILVRSADPFITEESLAELFNLPDGYIRVMNASNGRAFEKYSNMCAEKSPAYIVHNGSALGFVSAMSAAENLQDTKKLLAVLTTFGSAVGFGVVTLLSLVGGFEQFDALKTVAFQAAWCIFVSIADKIKRLGI